jgi:hypothetical protein
MKYKFVENFDDEKDYSNIVSYYQICIFPDPHKKMHHVRRFYINDKNEFVQVKDYLLTSSKMKLFLKKKKKNEYTLYSTYNLSDIEYPTLSDVYMLKSDILNHLEYCNYGAAPF